MGKLRTDFGRRETPSAQYVIKQNCRICGTENPHAHIGKPHAKQVTVWYGFLSRGIIGAFFIENEQELFVTFAGHFKRNFSHKVNRRILATFGFNGTTWHTSETTLDFQKYKK